jgi:D-lactate dehydrogenase
MKTVAFSVHEYERAPLNDANATFGHELTLYEERLHAGTAAMAAGFPAVCACCRSRR